MNTPALFERLPVASCQLPVAGSQCISVNSFGRVALLIFPMICMLNMAVGQSGKFGSPDFTEKVERLELEFFTPVERRIKTKKLLKDDFLEYDLVLRSRNQLEIRYILQPFDNQQNTVLHPHVELTRMVASVASNDEEEEILINAFSGSEAKREYGADWGLFADFVPKRSFSGFPKARIMSLYKEEKGLVNCIILYKTEDLEGFLGLPLRFKSAVE
jgi:hypothetical protein